MTKLTERILFTKFSVLFHQNMGPRRDIQIQKGSCGNIAKYHTKRCHFDTAMPLRCVPEHFSLNDASLRQWLSCKQHYEQECLSVIVLIKYWTFWCKLFGGKVSFNCTVNNKMRKFSGPWRKNIQIANTACTKRYCLMAQEGEGGCKWYQSKGL
jgi:hypothetical protein